MRPGQVLAERFVLDRCAGGGGPGSTWRAHDGPTGAPVAVRVLGGGGTEPEALAARARALAVLSHPGIVRPLAHGVLAEGEPWVAAPWIEGEELGRRLARGVLPVEQALALARRLAEALAEAHARGIVHGGVAPGRVLLPGGRVEQAVLTGFLTAARPGGILADAAGVAYLAPEQARGGGTIDPRADVHALGGLLYACLAGRPPFAAERLLALLAKIVVEAPPRLRDAGVGSAAAIDRLLARMMEKDPARRLRDGAAVVAALRALEAGAPGGLAPGASPRDAPSTDAGRVRCVLLAQVPPAPPPSAGSPPSPAASADAAAAPDEEGAPSPESIAAWHGARLDPLAGGGLLVVHRGGGAAIDQVARAARAALALRAVLPAGASLALAACRGGVAGGGPVGEGLDRAAALLAPAADGADSAPRPATAQVVVDEHAASLLERGFELTADGVGGRVPAGGRVLAGERDPGEPARLLLGRPSPFVGRDRELATLLALYEECVTEPVARAVLVTGAPGAGKSRLRQELLRRLRSRDDEALVWIARGDPMRAGAPFGLAGTIVRKAAALADGQPLAERRRRLRGRVGKTIERGEVERVACFLGELAGAPFEDDPVALRAARRDAALMADHLRRAFVDWLDAECGLRPVVLVLEDLQWGDAPSIGLVDAALRALGDRPLLVLAFARPEVRERFPGIWSERDVGDLRLPPLTRRACERLLRETLGDRADAVTVARILQLGEGNAFTLEELIRAVHERRAGELPATVLAMVEERLEALPAEARRVLRAASVFGQAFWLSGVREVLGADPDLAADAEAWLARLAERELVLPVGQSTFHGERAYAFRHALCREASYAGLADDERRLAHRLVADWLERHGETQARVLAEHWERGGEAERAIAGYRRAAEQALEGDDLEGALERARQALALGARGAVGGGVHLVVAEAHEWRGEHEAAAGAAERALEALPRGCQEWYAAASRLAIASGRLGRVDRLVGLLDEVSRRPPGWTAGAGPEVVTLAHVAIELLNAGRAERAAPLLERLAAQRLDRDEEPVAAAWRDVALAWRALYAGDTAESLRLDERAAAAFERAGDLRNVCRQRAAAAYERMELGAAAAAERGFREVLASAERMRLEHVAATVRHNLGLLLLRRGALEEAAALELEAVRAFGRQGDVRMEATARLYLALAHLEADRPTPAEEEARRALAAIEGNPPCRAHALSVLARVLLAAGRSREALAMAAEARALVATIGVDEAESFIRLTHVDALRASGDVGGARRAAAEARERLLLRAGRISDPEARETFLAGVPENARTLELAARLARSW